MRSYDVELTKKTTGRNRKKTNLLSNNLYRAKYVEFNSDHVKHNLEKFKVCLLQSNFYRLINEFLSSRPVFQLCCLGLGSCKNNRLSHNQLSLFSLLFESPNCSIGSLFDPSFTDFDEQLLKSYDYQVGKHKDEKLYYLADKLTVFFMPNCPNFLYERIFKANFDNDTIHNVIMITSTLSCLKDTFYLRNLAYKSPNNSTLSNIQANTTELSDIKTNSKYLLSKSDDNKLNLKVKIEDIQTKPKNSDNVSTISDNKLNPHTKNNDLSTLLNINDEFSEIFFNASTEIDSIRTTELNNSLMNNSTANILKAFEIASVIELPNIENDIYSLHNFQIVYFENST